MRGFRQGRLAMPDCRRLFHEQRKSRGLASDRKELQERPRSQVGRRR